MLFNFNQIEDGHVLHLVANPGVPPEQERGIDRYAFFKL